jgi:serine/threonine protein phosphatase Stp1
MLFEQAARSHVGCRRKNNEDALLSRPDIGLWAVADGMGGHAAGDVASALIVERLGQIGAQANAAALKKTVQAALEAVNRELWQSGGEGAHTMGSTVVALVAGGDGFSSLWAGDSRAYLLRDGKLRHLTRDHSLVQHLVDSGDLTPEAALNHPNANIITRAVGHAPELELDSSSNHDMRVGDHFLLASDGLTRLFGEDEMAAAQAAGDLEHLADRWVETALERGAPDNLSFVLIRVAAI